MPSGEIQVVVMEKNNIYPREIKVYSEFLVEAEKILSSVNDQTKFAPECLYTSFEPKNMLIFEDLKVKGYKVLPRNQLLDFDQALPIFIKLAKLHAVSAVLYEKNPSSMDVYLEGSISNNPDRQDFLVHYENCVRTLGLVVENEWSQDWKEIATKLKKLQITIRQKGYDVYTRDDTSFNVFNHNDLWTPNVLFRNNKNEMIEDILFVDFQLSCFNSPGIDLNFFIYGSLSKETRSSSKMKLIKIYHQTLSETLVKLNYGKQIPSLHDIHIELLKKGMNGAIAALSEVQLLLYQQSDDLQMDMLLQDSPKAESFRYSLFNNSKYKDYIQPLLIEFDGFGYLD